MSILITGITGFVGSHLADYLLEETDDIIHGLTRWRSPKENVLHLIDDSSIRFEYGDLTDFSSLYNIINLNRPRVIFHLAAQSYVPYSFDVPAATLDSNVIGTCNLLEAVKLLKDDKGYDPIVHICSSSEVYGQVSEDNVPITEDCPFAPASPYAVSKVGEDMLGFQYWTSWGVKTIRTRMFTHSVSKWTPVILKDTLSELIDIKYISEIRKKGKEGGYFSGKMLEDNTQIWDMNRSNLEVWNDEKWTKIKHISCHSINNCKMLEIISRGGVICATDNHSIIDEKSKEILASDLKCGDKIKITSLPNIEITDISEDLAWLYGFFVAEGTVTGGRLKISNKNIDLLEKSKVIFLKYLAIDGTIDQYKDIYTLRLRKPFCIAKRFYEDCYATDKNKKIPKIILNANKKSKISFLRGYNCGDGNLKNNVKSDFYRFKTKSPILAMGLCYFIESVLNVKYKINVEHRDDKRYFEIRCLSQKNTKNGEWLKKDNNVILKIMKMEYEDEVWDFETENHWFHAGIGGNIVHNTGPRRGDVFVVSAFAKQIAKIEVGLQKNIIHVGNLDSVRTFADVRDTVKAYWKLVNECEPGEVYNIGGNVTMTIGEMLDKLIEKSTMDNIEVFVDPNLLRPSDVTLQIPCTDKFKKATGWEPGIDFDTTLEDTLNFWREYWRKNG